MNLKNAPKEVDLSKLTQTNSKSKVFSHTVLYDFICKKRNIDFLDDVERKAIRKNLQNYTASELQKDTSLLFAIVSSDWHIVNANAKKYKVFEKVINDFIKKHS